MSQSEHMPEQDLRSKDAMLLDFLREFEAPCPVCGYNLKSLTRPVCPECGQQLVLTVGTSRLRLGWLFAALAPGFFSGIAACFLLIPIIARLIVGDGKMSLTLNVLDLFGWTSGAAAIILAVKRHRFIAMSLARQRWCTIIIWLIHLAALLLLIRYGQAYM